jgi:phage terminase large subunit-like protein
MGDQRIIKPQPGPQENFLASNADILIFGGAAFGGKSFGLLLESTRYISDPRYNGVIFRRESPQITSGGGLWDTASQIYPGIGGEAKEQKLTYTFPTESYIKFTHLQYEKDKLNHQGAQYVFIGFDELTHFTETQFWYLLTRNRPPTGCNLRPYCRATTNPESDSWVRELILWWIDEKTGYAIPERSGVIRYFTRIDEEIIWVDEDWVDESGNRPRSLTFIPSYLEDNPLGMAADPMYKSNLQAQDRVTRERLQKGNWNITYKGGMFNPGWIKIVQEFPPIKNYVRYWDRAATEPKDEDDDPDWTVGAKCGMYGGELYIEDIERFRSTPAKNEVKISKCAKNDGYDVSIGYEIEPGSSGIEVAEHYQKTVLKGYTVLLDRPKGSKVERCKPWAALAEYGHVYIKEASWNRAFLAEIGSFPLQKKDQVDAVSGCYKMLTRDKYVFPAFKLSDTKLLDIKWTPDNTKETMVHYGAMVQEKDMSCWLLETLYDSIKGKLYVYGCWMTDNPSP